LNREFANSEFPNSEFAGALAPRRRVSKRASSRHSRRRIARSDLRARRARRSPSFGVISPRPMAASTFAVAAAISAAERMHEKSIPSRSPGSGWRAGGGKTSRSTGSRR
jgi:hypothetical protein